MLGMDGISFACGTVKRTLRRMTKKGRIYSTTYNYYTIIKFSNGNLTRFSLPVTKKVLKQNEHVDFYSFLLRNSMSFLHLSLVI